MTRRIALLAMLVASALARADGEKTVNELRTVDAPHFRQGHTLPPLTRWGWAMPFDVRVELCERWGYALEFGGYVTADSVKALDDPASVEARVVALTARDPRRYPLCVLVSHGDFGDVPDAAFCRDADGKLVDGKQVWSPEAPDSIFRAAAWKWSEPIRRIRQRVPIAIVLNGGEYALSVFGFGEKAWSTDPKVVAARGERDWNDYISASKARQEMIVSRAVRAAVPDRLLYLYYYTDGCPYRTPDGTWWHWAWDYKHMRPVSDMPNGSIYFRHFTDGWTGDRDMLTLALNSVAQQIAAGDPLSYNWMNAGWRRDDLGDKAVSDREHYMGYLKCYYTAGMIGGVAGYFSYPSEDDPNWLWQMMALGHVHALFSHLEEFLRQGDLLPGPARHRMSTDLPAYEFPTGDQDARVLARKQRSRSEWLITAWAADGPDRDVSVTIPGLGEVSLRARSCGTVYRAVRKAGVPALKLIDTDGMLPTTGL